MNQKLERLSEGQKACLRLVNTHHSSKEIARILKISRHTVDQRLALACKILEARSRRDAARLFAEYDSFVYEPIDIGSEPSFDAFLTPPDQERLVGAESDDYLRDHVIPFIADQSVSNSSSTSPFPLKKGQLNDLNVKMRLFWIAIIFGSSVVISGLLIVALEALGRLF